MKTYLRLIPRNLIKNKKRTLALAVSIMLSIVLITSTEILIRSVMNASFEDNTKYMGRYHAYYHGMPYFSLDKLKQNKNIGRISTITELARSKNGKNVIHIYGIDDEAIEMLNIKLITGSFPKKEGEIAIEKWMLDKINPNAKLGDRIKFNCNLMIMGKEPWEDKKDVELTLCGILEKSTALMDSGVGKAYINIDSSEIFRPWEKGAYNQYFTIKKGLNIRNTIEKIKKEINPEGMGDCSIYEYYIKCVEMSEGSDKVVAIIDIIIALIASIMIYNIFNISIVERLKHFGLLRSIGITPFQIKILVFGEGIILGVLFIPLGIALGIKATELLISAIGGGIAYRQLVVNSNSYNILLITISGFLSIIIASYKPAKLASRVSPIEALSENDDVNVDIKTEGGLQKIIKKISGYTGNMAYMNMKRNKKRFFATAASISMGVIVFISINYFIGSVDPVKEAKRDFNSDYFINVKERKELVGYTDGDIEEIKNIEGIKEVKTYKHIPTYLHLDIKKMTEEGLKKNQKYIFIENNMCTFNTELIGCSKSEMERLVKELKLSDVSLSASEGQIPTLAILDFNGLRICNLNPGDVVESSWTIREYPAWKTIRGKFIVSGILKEMPFKLHLAAPSLVLITDENNLEKKIGLDGYQMIEISKDKGVDNDVIKQKLQPIVARQKSGELISCEDEIESIRKTKSQLLAVLSTLLLITLAVALVNIINTISMNVMTRKREFGMLRAIGMTKGQLRTMIIKEGMIYGFTGSAIGSLLGMFSSFMIYKLSKGNILQEMVWEIQYGTIALVFIVSMIVTTITTLVPLRKATSTNVVEAIRGIE